MKSKRNCFLSFILTIAMIAGMILMPPSAMEIQAEGEASYTLQPNPGDLCGGTSYVICNLTEVIPGMVNSDHVDTVSFTMSGGSLSDGNGHSISFKVGTSDTDPGSGASFGPYDASEQFSVCIFIDQTAYDALPEGTYTGTMGYSSAWRAYGSESSVAGASGSVSLTMTLSHSSGDCEHIHTKLINSLDAKCTSGGYSGDLICTDCNQVLEEGHSTAALGHQLSEDITITKEPTCTGDGEGYQVCERCGETVACAVKAPGHDYKDWTVCIEPHSFANGLKESVCDRCGHRFLEEIEKTGVPTKEDEQLILDAGGKEVNSTARIILDAEGNETGWEREVSVGDQVVEHIVAGEDGETVIETSQWIGGLADKYRYNGEKIKPEFHVYDGLTMLKAPKDYSYALKKNKDAGSTSEVKVGFKGDYHGMPSITQYFTIEPAVLGADVIAENYVFYSDGKTNRSPLPDMYWAKSSGNVKNEKFTAVYRKIETAEKPVGSVGGFADETVVRTEEIVDGIIPEFSGILPEYVTLGEETDSIIDPGLYQVNITSTSKNYTGSITVTLNVIGDKRLLLSSAKLSLEPKTLIWNGGTTVHQKGSYSLTLLGEPLTEGTDYTVSYKNNTVPGKATLIFTAVDGNKNGYVGRLGYNFTISARELKNDTAFRYEYPTEVPYVKGGAEPFVTVYDGDKKLTADEDYTLSYTKNTKVTDGATAVVTVKGKGNYTGEVDLKFSVTKQNIENLSADIVAADKSVSNKGYKKPSVKIMDLNGKKLASGTDYAIDPDSYKVNGEKSDTAKAGDTISMTIIGKKNYEGSTTVSYRYIKASQMLEKTKAVKIANRSYTGREITLGKKELSELLYTGSKTAPEYLVPGRDFIVQGYEKNIHKGTAKITLKGIGEWGGTKTLKFKIIPKK